MSIHYAYRTFKGRRADGQTVYGIIPQFDGSAYAGFNCGAASEAMRVVSQQRGVRPSRGSPWQPTGRAIRAATGDTSGGLNPFQTTSASERIYGVKHASPRIGPKQKVLDLLKAGYAVDLLVSYGPINAYRNGAYSGSPGFRGNHRIVLVGRNTETRQLLDADPLYDGRRSGIPYGAKWLPQSVIFDAASKLDLGGYTLQSKYGYDDAYYIPSLTNNVEPPPPLRVQVTCDTIARRGLEGTASPKLGNLNDGDVLTVTATSEGAGWTGCDTSGTKWRKFTSVNGKSTMSLYGRSYAYCAAGLTDPI